MEQLYPISGPTTSCASQDFDFLNYWVDQSVEKEIQRGKLLRELKQRPILRKQKYDQYDVINIGHTNIYSEKKHKRRSKSPYKSRKKTRRNSPKRKKSPVRKFTKTYSKSAHRCPMRIAELSVPSKRQCIETWRSNHHVLPAIMIDRLRQHVLNLSPIVKIPDAIECFKLHKKVKRKKKKETKPRNIKMAIKECDCHKKVKVKPTKIQQCRYLCAIFGHKIAKELNKPAQIILNPELQKISNIVSAEIDKLLNKSKGIASTNVKNKRVQAEVAGRITLWISNILEESAYKILEDQLKDLEEEVGPVLDLIDDLVDDVVDICEPEPEVVEVSSSSDTISIEQESQEEAQEYETKEEEEIREEESTSQSLSFHVDSSQEPEFTTESVKNLDDYIKNELDKIIDSFEQDDISFDIDGIAVDDDKFKDTEDQPIAIENQKDNEQNEFIDANDTLEVPLDETENHTQLDDLADGFQADQGTLITDQERVTNIIPDTDNSVNDIVSEDESNKKLEVPLDETENHTLLDDSADSSQADQGALITDQERDTNIITDPDDLVNDIVSEDESNKKVKFSDIHMVPIDEMKEQSKITAQHVNTKQFSSPNYHLLSDADESWPDDMTLPLVRPSESVSKSITSLGRIMEEEERMSTIIDYNTKSKDRTPDQNHISNNERTDIVDTSKQKEQDVEKFKKETTGSSNQKLLAQFEPPIESADNTEQKELQQLAPPSHKGSIYSNDQKDTELYIKGYFIDENGTIYTDDRIHCPSTDSTFPQDVPTESAEYEHKLPKITEEQEAKIEVEKGKTFKTRQDNNKTAEIETNTSYTLILRVEKSTSVLSQSIGDIAKYLQIQKPDWFSSVRIRRKDYKVDKKSAPTWVSRNDEEPCHISSKIQSKVTCDKNIRLWCKDLENGFDNLELWNGWLKTTVQCVKITEMKKARICLDVSREQFVRDWLHLKRNVDADVLTWTKLSKSTQDKMKAFRKIYHNFKSPQTGPKLSKSCNCQNKTI